VPGPVDPVKVVAQHPVELRLALRQVGEDVVEDALATRVDRRDEERRPGARGEVGEGAIERGTRRFERDGEEGR